MNFTCTVPFAAPSHFWRRDWVGKRSVAVRASECSVNRKLARNGRSGKWMLVVKGE
jgi:hypothetical protein